MGVGAGAGSRKGGRLGGDRVWAGLMWGGLGEGGVGGGGWAGAALLWVWALERVISRRVWCSVSLSFPL